MKRIVGLLVLSLMGTAALAHDDGHGDHFRHDPDRGHYDADRGPDDDNGDRDDHKKVSAPEIDPAGAFTAFALLAGGLAVLRGRRGEK